MTQQIILDINKFYPYGEIDQSVFKNKISVRKIVYFNTKLQYYELKQKIQVLKNIKHSSLIKIVNILQGEGQFHLIYQYIPTKYQSLNMHFKKENNFSIKQKLIEVFMMFASKKLITTLDSKNMGIDRNRQLKYYLDIQFFQINEAIEYSLKNKYIIQINKLLSNPIEDSYDSPKQSYYVQNGPQKKQNIISNKTQKKQPKFTKISSVKCSDSDIKKNQGTRNKMGSLQALHKIEQRINQLKSNSKKCIEMFRENGKLKQNLRETVKQNWKTQKIDTRKMSGHTIYQSYFNRHKIAQKQKTPLKNSIVKQQSISQTQIKQSKTKIKNKEAKNNKQQFKQKDVFFNRIQKKKISRKQSIKSKKEPSSKKDFEQLKKHEFQNFFKSKQKYVHQFLGLLGDVSQDHSKQTIATRNNKQKNIETRQFNDDYNNSRDVSQKLINGNKKPELIKKQKIITEYNNNFLKYLNNNMINSAASICQKINCQIKQDKNNSQINKKKQIQANKCRSLEKQNNQDVIKFMKEEQKVYSMRGSPKNLIKQKISKIVRQTQFAIEKCRKNSIISAYGIRK